MSLVVAVANQKGGVGKTTTVHSLGSALAERGHEVLLVDLDPQACLTFSLGLSSEDLPGSLHGVLVNRQPAEEIVTKVGELRLLPATIDLAGAEIFLMSKTGREYALSRALEPLKRTYDTILIDCAPSLGILTINGLTAASQVLIPLQCETLSHRGVGQLLETVDDVRSFTNPDLKVAGVIPTMFDGRTRLAQETLSSVSGTYRLQVFEPPVPKSVRVAEAPGGGRSVLEHASSSPAADAYRKLAAAIDERLR